jgi:hypothetical protein
MQNYFQTSSGQIIATDNPEIWESDSSSTKLPRTKGAAAYVEQCKASLLKDLKPGDTVYTVLRHVSASGMSRRIDLFTFKNNEPQFLSGLAAGAMGYKQHKDGGIVVGGCGMDMGFHLVYELSRTLFAGSSTAKDAGYALNHRWL